MEFEELEQRIVRDLAVELADEFDRNFERKAFFTETWPATKLRNSRGSVMMRSGKLRRSIKYNISNNQITFSSSLPYASINNEGGEIKVTDKMKRFFWAMYYKAAGAVITKKDGEQSKSKRNVNLTNEAAQWKALALMKVGQIIKVEKRQFVGDHPIVGMTVEIIINENMQVFNDELAKTFKK
jgi:phage gpG-like protein